MSPQPQPKPRLRTIFEVDPAGHDERVLCSKSIRDASGIETILPYGYLTLEGLIRRAALSHELRLKQEAGRGQS